MSRNLRIGLAQMACTLGDVAPNLQKVAAMVREYGREADLLVFPELTLTGYAVGDQYHQCAMRRNDPRLLELAKLAGGTTLQVGFIEETARFRFYNSVAVLREGQVLHVHRKVSLPNYGIFEEKKQYSPGSSVDAVRLGDFEVCPLICADAWNPGLVHVAAHRGATLLTLSVCSPQGGLTDEFSSNEGWRRLCRFYATMYGQYVAFVNRTGAEAGLTYWGGSELVDPFGRQLVSFEGREEGVRVGTLDLALVRKARLALPTLRDDDPTLLVRLLSSIS